MQKKDPGSGILPGLCGFFRGTYRKRSSDNPTVQQAEYAGQQDAHNEHTQTEGNDMLGQPEVEVSRTASKRYEIRRLSVPQSTLTVDDDSPSPAALQMGSGRGFRRPR